jgi:hypothetical protein
MFAFPVAIEPEALREAIPQPIRRPLMVLPLEEDYQPDEILQDGELEPVEEPEEEEVTELDFDNPAAARLGLDEILGEVETPDELFPIA